MKPTRSSHRALFLIPLLYLTAACTAEEVAAVFGPTDSLDGTAWTLTSTVGESTCPGVEPGLVRDTRPITFTQSGNDLTAVVHNPEIEFFAEIGGEPDSDLTGTRDGADFTMTGTTIILNLEGCEVTSDFTLTGTINSDGTLSGSSSAMTMPNDADLCGTVLEASVGEAIAGALSTPCGSEETVTATQE